VVSDYRFLTNDLDIDSDNNNGFDVPDSSSKEEQLENKINDKNNPGKLIALDTRISSVNNDNNLPGYANFNAIADKTFAPLVIYIPMGAQETPVNTFLKLSYYASDPQHIETYKYDEDEIDAEIQYIPNKGVMRIWTKNSTEDRSPKSVLEHGHYLPTDTLIRLSNLPALVDDKLILYVEVLGISEMPGNYLIQAKTERL
jgi:hypothetical protein